MIDFKAENRRQAYLDELYKLDNRDDPSHPHRHTYTGLYQQRQQQLLEHDMKLLLAPTGSGCAI